MFKYEMITIINENNGTYGLIDMGEALDLDQQIIKHLKGIRGIVGIRVIDLENNSHIDYWFGKNMPIEQAVNQYWLPMGVASFFKEHGINDVIMLKDSRFQACDLTNLPIASINFPKVAVKRSRKKARTNLPVKNKTIN